MWTHTYSMRRIQLVWHLNLATEKRSPSGANLMTGSWCRVKDKSCDTYSFVPHDLGTHAWSPQHLLLNEAALVCLMAELALLRECISKASKNSKYKGKKVLFSTSGQTRAKKAKQKIYPLTLNFSFMSRSSESSSNCFCGYTSMPLARRSAVI